jgi:hypothetical protein
MAGVTRGHRQIGWMVGALVLAVSLAGCASGFQSGPRRMKTEDFKWLAGPWRGTSIVEGEVSQGMEAVIYENGSFFTVPRGSSQAHTPGQMKVVDGGVIYDTPTSEGKMTFQEAGSEWVWRW